MNATILLQRRTVKKINRLFKKHKFEALVIKCDKGEVVLYTHDESGVRYDICVSNYGDVSII